MIRSIVVVVQVALHELSRCVRYGEIDGRVAPGMAHRPECGGASGQTRLESMFLEKVD
jgi:hypothetical protein